MLKIIIFFIYIKGMKKFIDLINNQFEEMMRNREDPNKHLFFNTWWKQTYKEWSEEKFKIKNANKYKYSIEDISNIKPLSECKFTPNKTLSDKYLEDFYELLSSPNADYHKIQEKCHEMINYNLPATLNVKDLSKWKKYDEKHTINVMILGSGPVGLFTALYLNTVYNKPKDIRVFSPVNINILLVDNRIKKENVKLPYSRGTQFGFNISELQPFLEYISCWNMHRIGTRAFDYIHVLENMLYTRAYHAKIPMLFTDKFNEYDKLESFIEKENINVLFDCSGGRTNIPVKKSLNIFKLSKFLFKEDNQEVKLNKKTNYYEHYENNELVTKPTLRLQLFDKQNKEILVGNIFGYPTDQEDIDLIEKYKNMCFTLDDYIKISSGYKKEQLRYLLPKILENVKNPQYVKINLFYSIARHSPFAAAKLNKKCILMRLGDSLGGTEYGIIFGMKHSIEFSRFICNL